VVFTSTRAGSTPEAIADASAGPPEAEDPELGDPEPDPKGNPPEPDEGSVVDGEVAGDKEAAELERQAIRPMPNPAAMASSTTSITTAAVHAAPRRAGAVDAPGKTGGATQ
jgi:hypothetical protein